MAIREIVQAFHTATRPEDVYQFALDRVSPLVGASLSCVYLREPDSDLLRLVASHNWPDRYARFLGEMRVRIGSGPSGRAVAERQPVEVVDVFADSSFEDWRSVATELGFRSLIALPLQTGDSAHGTITFYFEGAERASAEMHHLLRTVADQLAATAEKARMIADLQATNAALVESSSELERQFSALLDARRVKDEFLANISHELRTPLTAVIGYISLMIEGIVGPVTSDQQSTLGEVKESSEQLLALITDLLDLTTLKRGELEVNPTEFDLNLPLREAVDCAPGKTDAVSVEVAAWDTPDLMWNDRSKVTKILAILVGNAYKFTDEGTIRVAASRAANRVIYSVTDSGIGIPEEAQLFIFDEFRQADGTATRRYGGSGLGLALARRLARLLGGDVTVSSAIGRGSTFRLDLPLVFDGSEAASRMQVSKVEASGGASMGAES